LATLANFAPQVEKRLSQPAVTRNVSPTTIGRAARCQRSSSASPSASRCALISTASPALAPVSQTSLPPVNQPAAKA
jgi:hypothetical protein